MTQQRRLVTESTTATPPPDGGHGWLVAIGLGVFFVVTMGPLPSFGLVFSQFLDNLDIGARGVATVVSIFLATYNFSGVLCSLLGGHVSQRMLGCIAALTFFTGNLLSAFATSLIYLVVTYGVLQGIGFGMMKSVAHSTLNSYFRDKRTTANGIGQTINAVGSLFIPVLIRYLVDCVGFRGTEMVLAAISLHAFAAMMLMTPPRPRSSPLKDVLIIPLTSGGDEDTKSGLVHKFTLMKDTDETEVKKSSTFGYEPLLLNRPGPSSGAWENLVAVSSKCLRWIFVSLNLRVLKRPQFFSMALGVCMTHVADTTFFALQPILLLSLGYDKTFVTTVITTSAAGDIAGRVILSALGHWISSRNRLIFGLSSFLSAVHIIVFLLVQGNTAILGVTASMGFFRGCIYVTLPLVFGESFTVDEFPSVYNLYMVFCGFITMASGPVIGAVSSGDPTLFATFVVLATMLSVSVIIWSVEALFRYVTERRDR